MGVKIYISGISGNKEVKKRQQRVLMILDSKNIKYDAVDITEPGNEDAKEFMQNNAKSLGATVGDANPRSPLPPQLFNDEDYCGDYEQFDLANENDEIETFLKLAPGESNAVKTSNAEIKLGNGEVNSENVETAQKEEQKVAEEEEEKVTNEEEKVTNEEEVQKVSKEEEEQKDSKEEDEEQKVTEEEQKITGENEINSVKEAGADTNVENEESDKKIENGVNVTDTLSTDIAE